jgi:hypothetical protein
LLPSWLKVRELMSAATGSALLTVTTHVDYACCGSA